MLKVIALVLVAQGWLATAAELGVFSKGIRFDYTKTDAGDFQLVDNWFKPSNNDASARYDPDQSNIYYLFTRSNPSHRQVLVLNNASSVRSSKYNASKRTVILMHGFGGSATSTFNTRLVPAFLAGDDCNVIVLDWSAGSSWGPNAKEAGIAGGRFANWLMSVTGSRPEQFTIVGFSVGGHGAGFIGRTMNGDAGYIIACDPAASWNANEVIRPDDAAYTEVIHTSSLLGWSSPLGHVDFYPNQGRTQPGCLTRLCDHERSFHYIVDSMTFAIFGRRCDENGQAILGSCTGETLRMGGILPKTGRTGIYTLRTTNQYPFSRR